MPVEVPGANAVNADGVQYVFDINWSAGRFSQPETPEADVAEPALIFENVFTDEEVTVLIRHFSTDLKKGKNKSKRGLEPNKKSGGPVCQQLVCSHSGCAVLVVK
jgi:hypothetical protein